MIVDSNGNLFEDRRKNKDRRKNDLPVDPEKRTQKDRRDPKNAYKP